MQSRPLVISPNSVDLVILVPNYLSHLLMIILVDCLSHLIEQSFCPFFHCIQQRVIMTPTDCYQPSSQNLKWARKSFEQGRHMIGPCTDRPTGVSHSLYADFNFAPIYVGFLPCNQSECSGKSSSLAKLHLVKVPPEQ